MPQVPGVVLTYNRLLMVTSHIVPFHSCKEILNPANIFLNPCKDFFKSCTDICRFPSACFDGLGTLTVSIEVVEDGHTSLVALPRVRLGSAAPVVAMMIMLIIIVFFIVIVVIVFFIVIVVIVFFIVKIVVTVIVCKKTYPPVWDQSWN